MRRLFLTIKKHDIKISAFSKSMGNLDIDYNLDCLLNFSNPTGNITFNDNYSFYFNEIKRFSPDLIISDLEVYTSIIALEMSKPLWQVSPVLLYTGAGNDAHYANSIRLNNSYLINRTFTKKSHINFVINNSDKKLIYSHLCDIKSAPTLSKSYEWIRPEFQLFDNHNQKTISINDGTETQLSDAFYNEQFSYSQVDYKDIESVVCSNYNEHYGLGNIITNSVLHTNKDIDITINDSVKFLSDLL